MRQGLAALVMLLTAAGCNVLPSKAYDGPSRPSSELSRLKGGASGDQLSLVSVVDFRSVDGVAHSESSYLLTILPGRHAIGLTETRRLGPASRIQYCVFELDALAGCTYVPRPPSPPTDALTGVTPVWEWSVDMSVTGECVSGDYQSRMPARCGSSVKLLESAKK